MVRWRNLSFGVLLVTLLVSLSPGLRAYAWPCDDMGLWEGLFQYCETDTYQVCAQTSNPGGYFCSRDFEDTCDDFCGNDSWIGDDCYWDETEYDGNGWYCAQGWFIRCVCSDAD